MRLGDQIVIVVVQIIGGGASLTVSPRVHRSNEPKLSWPCVSMVFTKRIGQF